MLHKNELFKRVSISTNSTRHEVRLGMLKHPPPSLNQTQLINNESKKKQSHKIVYNKPHLLKAQL